VRAFLRTTLGSGSISAFYFSMIEIGQHGKQAMKDIDEGLAR
jgi:hypothetical protein